MACKGHVLRLIAAQTGVTKAMIHYYFESKENLYREVLRRVFSRRSDQLQSLRLPSLPPPVALTEIFRNLLGEVLRHPTVASILFFESVQNRGKYYRELSVASLYDPLMEVLQRGIASGDFRAEMDPRHTAVNMVGMAVFYVCSRENLSSLWPNEPDLLSKEMFESHVEATVSMVCNAVLKR